MLAALYIKPLFGAVGSICNDHDRGSEMASVWLDWDCHPPAEFTGGAVTVGNFDGVHRGHLALLAAARSHAHRIAGPVVAVSFDPPPFQVLNPFKDSRLPLTTVPQRIDRLHAAGADHVVILRTVPALLALSPEAFFEDVIVRQLGAKALVEGYDFRFGRARQGTNSQLKELCTASGLAFEEVSPFHVGGEVVSSSRVRSALEAGDVHLAHELLARPYTITGVVVSGVKRGRTIGFPTANLAEVLTLLPAEGVYAVRATVEGRTIAGAANIGPNPTFGEHARKIEIHLLDFQGDLYGRTMDVAFVARLRETKPFSGPAALIEQLQCDVANTRRVLENEFVG